MIWQREVGKGTYHCTVDGAAAICGCAFAEQSFVITKRKERRALRPHMRHCRKCVRMLRVQLRGAAT